MTTHTPWPIVPSIPARRIRTFYSLFCSTLGKEVLGCKRDCAGHVKIPEVHNQLADVHHSPTKCQQGDQLGQNGSEKHVLVRTVVSKAFKTRAMWGMTISSARKPANVLLDHFHQVGRRCIRYLKVFCIVLVLASVGHIVAGQFVLALHTVVPIGKGQIHGGVLPPAKLTSTKSIHGIWHNVTLSVCIDTSAFPLF